MSSLQCYMLLLTFFASLVLGTLIASDVLYIDEAINTDPVTDHTDNELYIQRAESIMAGKVLYRDVETQTPPLINYLLVPPVAFGASALAFEVYFSSFIVMTTLALFWVLSRIDEALAFRTSLAFLLIPTTLITPIFARQDESIVVFFVLLPVLMVYVTSSRKGYSLLTALGVWIKMHSIFLIPPLLLKSRRQQLVQELAILGTVTLVITVPFFVLAFNEFVWHLRFYLLGEGDRILQGISLWRIMESESIGVPSLLLIGIMGIIFLSIYKWSYRHNAGIWKTVAMTLIVYFVMYPKIHYEYFLILFAILIPLLIESKKAVGMLYGISMLSGIALFIEQRYLDWQVVSAHDSIMVSLAALCMIVIDILLIFIFRDLLMTKNWLDRKPLF